MVACLYVYGILIGESKFLNRMMVRSEWEDISKFLLEWVRMDARGEMDEMDGAYQNV